MRASRNVLAMSLVTAVAACSGWPGLAKDGNTTPGGSDSAVVGTCTGTPLPCSALSGGDCTSTSGCMDLGSCSGTPSVAGAACGAEISYQACVAIPGCFWSASCTGTPLGTCSGVTEATCLLAKGCAFIPSGAGGAGGAGGSTSSSTCNTYAARCSSGSSCDCGYSCVQQCPTCAAVCGHPCQGNLDCVGAASPNGATPYCTGLTNPPTLQYPGLCADAPL